MNSHDGCLVVCFALIPIMLGCLYFGFAVPSLCLIASSALLLGIAFTLFWFRLEISQNKVTLTKFFGFIPYYHKSLKFENFKFNSSVTPASAIEFNGIRHFSLEYYWDGQGYYWFDYPTSFILFTESNGIVISTKEKHFNKLINKLRAGVGC